MIYLDNAASTIVSPTVKQAVIDTMEIYGNPSSIHSVGEQAKDIITESTGIIANKLNCKPSEINYTTGATMSNSLAIQGFLRANPTAVIFLSRIEHNDIIMLGKWLSKRGISVRWIDVDVDGYVDLHQLEYMLDVYTRYDRPILVSIQMANGEIGTIQNIKKISNIIHKRNNVYFHTDATQYIPYYPIDLNLVDMMSMSGQKINCIKGTGLLYIKEGTPISPVIFGEQGYIGGTENIIGIRALATAINEIDYSKNDNLIAMRNYIISNAKGCIVGSYEKRLPNNICLFEKGLNGTQLVYLLNECDIAISSGSACSNLSDEPSHVLKAVGFSDEDAECCIRITVGNNNTMEEIKYVVEKLNMFIGMM